MASFWMTLLLLGLPLAQTAIVTNTTMLYNDLLNNYVKTRPALDFWDTVTLDLSMELFQIKSLDGKNQILSTFGQLNYLWNDINLKWNPAEYGGVIFIELPASAVWRPEIGLRNSAASPMNADWPDMFSVFVFFSGDVSWFPAGAFDTSCDLDMFQFPYDTQTCSLDWGAMMLPDVFLNLTFTLDTVARSFFTPSKEFELSDTWVDRIEYTIDPGDGSTVQLPNIRFWLKLKRLPAYYLLNIIIPTIVLAILSAFTFMVPVDAGEKLSLSITVLLSFSVFMLLLSDITPQTSENTPILAIYLTVIICIGGLSMLFTMLSLNMYHRSPVTPIPHWLRSLTIDYLGTVFNRRKKARVAHIGEKKMNGEDIEVSSLSKSVLQKKTDVKGYLQGQELPESLPVFDALLQEVRKLTTKLEEDSVEDEMKAEWMLAAHITDRFFFAIFIILQIIMIIVVFIIVPYSS